MRLSLYQLWFELKRRKVVQALVAYGALSWLVLQITDVARDGLDLPSWTFRLVVLVLALGLPVVLALAWIFDFGPGGLVRTSQAGDREQSMLAVVLTLHIKQWANANERPALAALQRKVLTAPSLWRRWHGDGATLVLPDARRALWLASELQRLQRAIGCEGHIGLALGEVHFHDDVPVGDAARVAEVLASQGTAPITASEAVHDALHDESAVGSRLLGPLHSEQLPHPVRAYALEWVGDGDAITSAGFQRLRWAWLLLPLVLAVGWWQWQGPQPSPDAMPLPSAPLINNAAYIQLSSQLDPASATPALRQALQRLQTRVLERVPGVYRADADTDALATRQLHLQLQQRDGQLLLSAQLTSTGENAKPSEQHWQRPPEQLQALLDDAEQALAEQLAAPQTPLALAGGPLVDSEVFAALLDAEQRLQQAQAIADYQAVLQEADRLLAQAPDFAEISLLGCRAGIYLYRNAEAEAYIAPTDRHCDHAVRSTNVRADMLVAAARWRHVRGDDQTALQLLQQALRQEPMHAAGLAELANLHADAGNDVEAEHTYRRAIQLQPNYWPPYRALAVFQMSRGRFPDAAQNYRKVISLTPPNARAYSDLGAALFMTGDLQAAADAFALSLKQQDDPDTASNLATLYYFLGRMPEAVRLYEQALARVPEKAVLHANLADALWQSGDRRAAAERYRGALALINRETNRGSSDATLLAIAAHAQQRLGERDQATVLIGQALQLGPQNPDVQFRAGLIALQQGARQKALDYLQNAQQQGYPAKLLAVDPDLANLATEPAFLALLSERR